MRERIELMHVNTIVSKGRTYRYHRKTGERLPDDATKRAYRVLEINASLDDEPEAPGRGTFAELIAAYQAAPEFRQRAVLTRRDYSKHLSAISDGWGRLTVKGVMQKHVRAMRDNLADTPRKANYRMAVLSILLNYAIATDERLYGQYNPVTKVKKLDEGPGYSPWPENVIQLFAQAAYPELRHVVIGGALGTGQRGQDVVAMSWVHLHDGGMEVVQHKTRERLLLPITTELEQALESVEKSNVVIFTTKTGRPWNLGHLRHEVERLLKGIGHPGYSLHGLRFNAARRLYETGASWEEIAAVTGHRTASMARQYATRAERARTAVDRLRTNKQRIAAKPAAKPLTGGTEKL